MKLISELISARANSRYNIDSNEATLIKAFEDLVVQNPKIGSNEVIMALGIKKINNFKALKHRLEYKLINDLFIGMEKWETLEKRDMAKPTVLKLYTISLSLLKSNRKNLAVTFMERALSYSIKYDFTEITQVLAKTLMMHYSISEVIDSKAKYYTDLLEITSYKNTKETFITASYAKVTKLILQNTGKLQNEKLEEIGRLASEMTRINSEISTYVSQLYTFDVNHIYFLSILNYEKALENCHTFEHYLKSSNIESGLLQFLVYKNSGIVYYNLRNYISASIKLDEALKLVTPSSNYWAYITSFQFINLSHSGDYQSALNLTIEALNNKHLKLHPIFEELWKIREAYMHLLIRAEKVSLTSQQKEKIRPFSLNKFLNDVPFYSKDKTGEHINILILQIQFLFLERKYNMIIDRKEALEKYSQRYIVKNKYFRAQCFINMVLTAIKCNFHPVRTKTLAQKYFIKLNTHALELNENEPTIEIIPYDKQWEILMELMVRNVGK